MADPNAKPDFAPSYWAKLSPLFRAAHNRLRRTRGLPPIPEPKVDHYKPPRETMRPIDLADPEAADAARDFLGRGDQEHNPGSALAQRLALDLARARLANRKLHTEVLHRAIAKFVALATKESGWHRKRIIDEATKFYGVSESTVEKAIAKYPRGFYFTTGAKLVPPGWNVWRYSLVEPPKITEELASAYLGLPF